MKIEILRDHEAGTDYRLNEDENKEYSQHGVLGIDSCKNFLSFHRTRQISIFIIIIVITDMVALTIHRFHRHFPNMTRTAKHHHIIESSYPRSNTHFPGHRLWSVHPSPRRTPKPKPPLISSSVIALFNNHTDTIS